MALAVIASNATIDESRSIGGRAQFCYTISFDGDAAYATGGTAGFQQFIRNLLEANDAGGLITITDVSYHDCGGYTPAWTGPADDKLKVYRTGATTAPMGEVPAATDLSGTRFTITVHGT